MASEPRMHARLKTCNSFALNKSDRNSRARMRGSTERNVMSDQTETPVSVAIGTWIGREQAFNAMAHHCSEARVACLKQVRETEAFKTLNLTWEEFCPLHAGISRAQADRLISQLSEFGVPYFQLTDIVPVSPAAYREIEPAIIDGAIEFRGERIPITRENAVRIKTAVSALRKDIERAESENLVRSRPNITSLQIRFDAYCEDIRRLIHHATFEENKPAIRALLFYSAGKITELSKIAPSEP
jgi:hypothetical protein